MAEHLYPKLTYYLQWDENYPIEQIDFTIASNPALRNFSEYDKGKKTKTYYHNPKDSEDVVVTKEFVERYQDLQLDIIFTWFDQKNGIFAQKTKTVDLNASEWESRFRAQRERIFDDLKGRAKKYNAEHYIDAIYSQFSAEKLDFVNTGSFLFSQTIQGFLMIDSSLMPDGVEKRGVEQLQALLNASLDGVVKVYETLIHLTT